MGGESAPGGGARRAARRGVIPLAALAARQVRRPFQRAVALWRRSIQLRVVATTLVLSLGVVLLLGVVVMAQVRTGLLGAKRQVAESQAAGGFSVAQKQIDAARDVLPKAGSGVDPTSEDIGDWITKQVEQLASSGQGVYSVVALVPSTGQLETADSSGGVRSPRSTGNVLPQSVPDALQQELADHPGRVQEQPTVILRDQGDSPRQESGLAIGKQLTGPEGTDYQLYYVFPFQQETRTLGLVTGTLATAGVFVVVLLGAIAWMVVRMVVTPVRMAAGISERLAAGHLEERMKVTGTDDIARLGDSFNEMANALWAQIRQLEELSRVQRRFVSDVSHELRTPLTTVRMAADLLYEGREDMDPASARSAELLQGQLDRFESLLSDLLEISRFDAGAAVLDAEPADLREITARVVEAAEPLAQAKGSALLVRGAEEPVMAEVDPRRIERILRNLVVNALEHGEGRDVVVRLASGDGSVAVAVRDHGIGLKPGEASRVFHRFWRADPARQRTTGGTGLGLSIALEDAHLHGGWLQAWGEPGGGSQFRLTVPRTRGGEIGRSPIPLEPEDSRHNRGLSAPGTPYRRVSRPGGPGAAGAGEGQPETPENGGNGGSGFGPGLGGVLTIGPGLGPGARAARRPASDPSDVRAGSAGYGATGAHVVVERGTGRPGAAGPGPAGSESEAAPGSAAGEERDGAEED
ncbi:MtrAB system histidine kinase MtrB [Peterkaempfera bronchialis]|uniref:Sensor histidine kinase MtrB n=1 Tax=Peterkaempfera bronchialis TaxID=2126346 RepID=A0A345SVP2_9ACTN|nr:MtrAB system histidine kinase MtrB [Peterkaempfera bronchialis]AXI77797.1 sensor histidine kinase [Peterkaempfera bronchialis]